MKLLALDQSSRVTGYAVFEDDKPIEVGLIKVSSTDVGKRLYKLREEVIQLINKYDIDEVVYEDIQLQDSANNNVNTFKVLAETFGVLHELFAELQIPAIPTASSSWRSTLSLKGRYRKDQKANAQKYTKANYNLDVTEDEADAVCIGAAYLKKSQEEFDWS